VPSTSIPAIARRRLSDKKRDEVKVVDLKNNEAKKEDEQQGPDLTNPLLEKYLQQKELEAGQVPDKNAKPQRPQLREGSLSEHPSSLFLAEREIPGWHEDLSPQQQAELKAQFKMKQDRAKAAEERELLKMNLDPDEIARQRLEKKLIISGVKRHGRMTKADKLLRTERQSLYKSHALPTSTKKLQKVVNQIAGKTISEALVQLRFSPKRIARDVIKGLEIAQDEAIAARGMGLAGGDAALARWTKQRERTDAGKSKDIWGYKTSEEEGREGEVEVTKPKVPFFKEQVVELKKGGKKLVRDPSEIYIEQAWVGPGESWKSPEFRARGAINMLKHRTTSKFQYP
jgi:ribosomal protein L22